MVPRLVPHPPEQRAPGGSSGRLGGSGGGAELRDVQLWVSPWCRWGGETGASSKLMGEVQGPGKAGGRSVWCFGVFFPGKGYSLSLGAVVIAGGGSGLNFRADALRSRQLALPACLSGALTCRAPEAVFPFAPASVCQSGLTAVLGPEGLCHKGGTPAAAEMQGRGTEGAAAGTCRSAGHQLNAPGCCSAFRGTVSTPPDPQRVQHGGGHSAGVVALTLWAGKPLQGGGILWGCAALLAGCMHLLCSA